MRSARQRGDSCSGSSKKEKVKLREKLRLVTGRSGGRRGGRGTRGKTLRLARNPLPPPPAETERDSHRGSEGEPIQYPLRTQSLTVIGMINNDSIEVSW